MHHVCLHAELVWKDNKWGRNDGKEEDVDLTQIFKIKFINLQKMSALKDDTPVHLSLGNTNILRIFSAFHMQKLHISVIKYLFEKIKALKNTILESISRACVLFLHPAADGRLFPLMNRLPTRAHAELLYPAAVMLASQTSLLLPVKCIPIKKAFLKPTPVL